MTKSLPSRPNLEQLKNQAKDLLKSLKLGDASAHARFAEYHPKWSAAQAGEMALADAQLVIAREYGFASWAKLREHVHARLIETENPLELLKQAFHSDDAALFRKLLERYPKMKTRTNDPVAAFNSPIIHHVRSREMLDVLIEAGADLNLKSNWWAGGFGLLHCAEPDLAKYAAQRGAHVDAHAAARLGMIGRLRELVAADPAVVNERGGDGQTPLHFASTVEIAEFLLDHGANIDVRDIDHESTPAQYMIRDRQDIARFLVERGCWTDIFMAAALGDIELVSKHLDAEPKCVGMRVSEEFFPMVGGKSGGTIYQWTLGWHVAPHDVARDFGHAKVLRLLMDRSPANVKLLAACWAGDEDAARSIIQKNPDLVANLSEGDRRQVAHAARNNKTSAVKLMLKVGLPVDAVSQHRATPLHWAAFHGNAEMARAVLDFNPPLEKTDADFQATPLGWAVHGSNNGWHRQTGDYLTTVQLLLNAGAKIPKDLSHGTDAVRELIHRHASGA
ncbi:ankyrin repeat domain-containing protein [bacterium]|nr:ankyrin repeat domain-containing protein [bacterium]